MYQLKNMLLAEQKNLELICQTAKEQLSNAPDGSLRLSKSKNKYQYYQCTDDNPRKNGSYILKEQVSLAQQLAQKQYAEKVLHLAQKRLYQLRRITNTYQDDEFEQIFLNEHPARQALITPIVEPWKSRQNNWINTSYIGKEFQDGLPLIISDRGERVRSKSEKILADYFYHHGIPYKYEKELYLNGYGTIHPDFTLLSPKTGEELYWEHNGKMDDPKYVKNALRKLALYERNGIFLGERLILTFETNEIVLNSTDIERKVQQYLT